jgi:hypothetical protein
VHNNSSLGGDAFAFFSILLPLVDSKDFVESIATLVIMGEFLLPFAMQPYCFLGPSFKVPRVCIKGVVCISVYDGITETLLQSLLEEFDGSDIIERDSGIASDSLEVSNVGIKVVFLLHIRKTQFYFFPLFFTCDTSSRLKVNFK